MASLSVTFDKLAQWTAYHAGRPAAFALAAGAIVVWLVSGPIFQWSDTWQLVINTGTTIVTFLMVFLIQNTQNRDSEAIQIKLDELIVLSPSQSRTRSCSAAGPSSSNTCSQSGRAYFCGVVAALPRLAAGCAGADGAAC